MTDDLVKQSIAELQDLVRCRCHDAYKVRGLHDPDCECDNADVVQIVADRIEELEASLQDAHRVGAEWLTTAEAKLAKAESIVRILASAEWDDRLGEAVDLACAYLAEEDEG